MPSVISVLTCDIFVRFTSKKTYYLHPQTKDGKPIKHLGIRIQNKGNGELADVEEVLYSIDMLSSADCEVCCAAKA